MCVVCLKQLLQTQEVKRGLDGAPGGWDLSVSWLRQFCRVGERLRCHSIGLFTCPEGIAPAVNKIIFNVWDLQLLPDSLGISVLEHIFHLHSDQGLTFFSMKWKLFMPGVSFVPLVLELIFDTQIEKQEQSWEDMLAERLFRNSQPSCFIVQSASATWTPILVTFVTVYRMVDLGQCTLFGLSFLYLSPPARNHAAPAPWIKERNGQ